MTRPEPEGAGTADDIARQLDATIHADAAEYHAHFRRLVDAAITAAESRAMERCAKIAESEFRTLFGGDYPVMGKAIAAAIRSSINPPGEEE